METQYILMHFFNFNLDLKSKKLFLHNFSLCYRDLSELTVNAIP